MSTLLKKIKEAGFSNFKTLSEEIKSADLGKTSFGYIYPAGIVTWIEYNVGIETKESKEIFDALVKMGYLKKNEYGNIYG